MKLSELATTLTTIEDQITKAQAEIVAQIAALQDALADVEIPAEAQVAIDALSATATALDNLNPDA